MAAAAVIAAAAFAASPDAMAQRRNNDRTAVVVINYQRVLTETALGRDMATKLQQVRAQVAQEAQALQPEGQSIDQERQRLAQATRNLSAEQIRNSSTWAPQFQALADRMQQLQQRTATLQGDYECTQAIALRDFDRQVTPVVRGVMESRGASVVLDANNIQLALPEVDITNTVIQQLDQNQATRVANVSRRPVAECQSQPQQQPAAPQPQ